MLPEYEPILNLNISTGDSETSITNKKSFLFDFEIGDFYICDGKIQVTEGIEALKVWIQKVLRTEKFKFKIYDTGEEEQYGISILDFLNNDYPQAFLYAEIQREVTEALLKNPDIIDVSNFNFVKDKRILDVSFDVNSIFGVMEQAVRF